MDSALRFTGEMRYDETVMSERVELKTADGLTIVGDHYKESPGSPGILLLHMMPATRQSWMPFAEKLHEAGFGVLAIDLRGHGESSGGPQGFEQFDDAAHQATIQDIRAAVDFQKQEGHAPLFLAGASIGANLSLQYLVENSETKAAILLSPGVDYRGIQTLPLAARVGNAQSVFIAAARDDVGYYGSCGDMAEQIFSALTTPKKEIQVFGEGGHGTNMFQKHPELVDMMVIWLKKML